MSSFPGDAIRSLNRRALGFAAGRRFHVPSQVQIWALALLAGCLMFASTLAAQWYIYVELMGQEGLRLVGAAVSSILTIILVQQMMSASRQRRLTTLHQFQIVVEMNHHIRNSLQTIMYQQYSVDSEAAARLKDAVERIEWVLNEVLPAMQVEGKPPKDGIDKAA